ncbi:MAG: siroheme synthase CysG [Acidibrevibacterium sp.]|uniref:siroheme synthase CysG n=1 Tax=Acidibrevibacterium sp. TaxID=2606776 RepID=UPI003D00B343
MRHFPIFLDLAGRRALVLGEGAAAARKADALAEAGATVTRVARFAPARSAQDCLAGVAIAIGAEAPETDLQALSEAAQALGIPVNIVDRPALSSFIMPALIDRDPLTIAIASGGAAPVLARQLRAKIEALIPPAYGRLAAFLGRAQGELRRRFPDLAQRRRLIERLLGGRVAALVFAGREAEAEAALAAELAASDTGADGATPGMVFLVGAGPGAADLLTLRAQRLLGEADVIVHDRLVGDEVLALARRDATRIFVGKARAHHCLPQSEINALLVGLARAGKKVVRLKGGDPFIFGRGGEEAEALAEAGIACEIVPGVTAALACAAAAGIPLTHRDAARSVTLLTGHGKEGVIDLDFAALVRLGGTLAIYMAITALPRLAAGFAAAGLAPETPAALIERGGTPAERRLFAPLPELATRAPAWSSGGPALLLIGPAVARAGTATREAAADLTAMLA